MTKNTDARRKASSVYRDALLRTGYKRITVLLSPSDQDQLNRYISTTGMSQQMAVQCAIQTMNPPEPTAA